MTMDRGKLEALCYHASQGNYSDVQSLVNEGVDPNGKDSYGQTPLILAARGSHREVVQLFIISGADIHCCDNNGWTVLHHASNEGWVDIVKCLVNKGVAIDMKNSDGKTPLLLAAQWSHRVVMETLINLGADIQCCDNNGCTVLHHALNPGCLDIVQFLVNKGVAINMKNSYGKTPLHLTVEKGRINISDYLLRAGADCNLEDNEGESPFSFLIRQKKCHVETIKLCIQKGAYVKSNDYNRLLKDPLLKEAILQDVQLSSQAMINKFNNKDLPSLYKGLAPGQKLPHFDRMKIRNGTGMALEVERSVTYEIQTKGFCNLFKMVPLVLGILCVKSSLEKSRPAFNQASMSASQNSLKRLGENNKQEHPCKKKRN